MSTFRERPVTWLFVAASAAVAAVSADGMLFGSPLNANSAPSGRPPWLSVGILSGATYILGAYAVVGRSHRLWRACLFVLGAPVIAAIVAVLIDGSLARWSRPTAALGFMEVAAAGGGTTAWIAQRLLARRRRAEKKFRYPIVEFFGWTIIVAIASVLFRYAPFGDLLNHNELPRWLGSAGLAGACVGVALLTPADGFVRSLRERVAVALSVLALLTATVAVLVAFDNHEEEMLATSIGYVALFVLCWSIDRGPAAVHEDDVVAEVSTLPLRKSAPASPFE